MPNIVVSFIFIFWRLHTDSFSFGAVLTLVEATCGSLGTLLPKLYVSSFVCQTVCVRRRSPSYHLQARTQTKKMHCLNCCVLCTVVATASVESRTYRGFGSEPPTPFKLDQVRSRAGPVPSACTCERPRLLAFCPGKTFFRMRPSHFLGMFSQNTCKGFSLSFLEA